MKRNIVLDYNILDKKFRLKEVNRIIEEYEEDLNEKELEYLGTYLINSSDDDDIDLPPSKEYPILTKQQLKEIKRREVSLDALIEQEYELDEMIDENNDIFRNTKKYPKMTITNEDIERNADIRELQKTIDYYKAKINSPEVDQNLKYKYKKLCNELRYDQVLMKQSEKPYIQSMRLGRDTTLISFDDDTGYTDDNGEYHLVSKNKINLSDPFHVKNMLKFYSDLKMEVEGKFDSDMWHLLIVLEDTIDRTSFTEVEKEIMILYVDRLKQKDIAEQINQKFGKSYDAKNISKIINSISKKIANAYKNNTIQFENKQVEYRRCTKCGKLLPLTHQYFRKDRKNKQGYSTICKVCRKKEKKEKNSAEIGDFGNVFSYIYEGINNEIKGDINTSREIVLHR
jgi:hypothetical protein